MMATVAQRKLRSPLKWHGGKSYLARRIIALMPPHRVYCEPFLGGGSVLLNKPKSEVEAAADLNGDLINFWMHLKGDIRGLRIATGHAYTLGTFEDAKRWAEAADGNRSGIPLTRAAGFLIRNRFSRGGLGKDFAWSDRLRGGQPGDVNAWETIREELPAISERIRDVDFAALSAIHAIPRMDGPDTLFYCDPPYLHETRTHKKAYAFEMGREDHVALLKTLLACQGTVMLSGYRSALYDDMLAGWTCHEFDMPNHSGQGKSKQRRTECLWINREAVNVTA